MGNYIIRIIDEDNPNGLNWGFSFTTAHGYPAELIRDEVLRVVDEYENGEGWPGTTAYEAIKNGARLKDV